MAKVKNLEEVIKEEEKIVWILITRNKSTKQIVRRVCKDGQGCQDALTMAKADGETFITLTTEARARSFFNGNPVKAWDANYAALVRRGVEVNYDLFKCVFDWLDCTTEVERWTNELDGNPVIFRQIVDADRMDNVQI